jgi:hypothetical protein
MWSRNLYSCHVHPTLTLCAHRGLERPLKQMTEASPHSRNENLFSEEIWQFAVGIYSYEKGRTGLLTWGRRTSGGPSRDRLRNNQDSKEYMNMKLGRSPWGCKLVFLAVGSFLGAFASCGVPIKITLSVCLYKCKHQNGWTYFHGN